MRVTETVYKGKIRPWGKTRRSLSTIPLPKVLSEDLAAWKVQAADHSPDAFIFPNKDGGPLDTDNYRKRVLHKLVTQLGLPKLTFQVIRRSIATLAQRKGTVKDVQGVLRHSRTATTTDVYMQEISAGVEETVNLIHRELIAGGQTGKRPKAKAAPRRATDGTARKRSIGKKEARSASERISKEGFRNLLPNATKPERADSVSY
jgi:hypothetical protein